VGVHSPPLPDERRDGRVEVTDRDGEPVAGEPVRMVDPDTGGVLFEGTTDPDGTIDTTLDRGDYRIKVGDRIKSVGLDDDEADVEFEIDTTRRTPVVHRSRTRPASRNVRFPRRRGRGGRPRPPLT